jgi:hypothetical protein
MHDESVNEQERAFAAFLDRLAAGEPGEAGVDPALAETARDLHDRAAHSTVSAPPAGTLASIRADLFGEHAVRRRDHAALGLVPFPSLLTRPAAHAALVAAILLALITGFATFRGNGWLAHGPTSTHSALAASATAPTTTQLAMSPDNGISAETSFSAPGTAVSTASSAPALSPEVQSLIQTCPMPDAKAITLPITSGQYIRNAWGLGKSPLWLVGLGNTPSWYHPTDPGFVVSGTNGPSEVGGRPGQRITVLWLMDPNHPQPVNVRGKGINDGPDLFFENDANVGGSKEINFTQGGSKGIVYMWWTTIIYTQPGCYEITATWASGSWTIRLPLPPPATNATPTGCATPVLPGTPPVTTRILSQAPPPFATRQPPIPYITPGIQQIITPPGIPLVTPTPFATIIGVATPPGTPPSGCN